LKKQKKNRNQVKTKIQNNEMKKFILIAFAVAALIVAPHIETKAQEVTLYSPYSLSSDTVTNGGTAYLSARARQINCSYTAFQVDCTEISGTTGGTITIQGSIDGTDFKAIPTAGTQTSITTATALDVASQTFIWYIQGNPYPYYRVSWTGTGTMAASFTAQMYHR
jgi:hypothetical protein